MAEPVISFLRWRVVQTFNAGNSEITNDLPTLHQAHIEVAAVQAGNPASSALGSFTIPLHPPGTEAYDAAKPIYDKLDYYQRVEGYISPDGASLGKLYYAGIITGIRKIYGETSTFELSGKSDLLLANLSKPFPGELLSNDVTSNILKSFLGTNEIGWSDTFTPFTAANYISTALPNGGTAGSWTGTTDDGFNVVTNSTGTAAVLLSKSGAAANDRWNTHYVEATGRISPSSDTTRAAEWGIGFSNSGANVNDGVFGFVVAKKLGSRYQIDVGVNTMTAGVMATAFTNTAVLMNVDDPQGFIPMTMGLLWTNGGGSTSTPTLTLMLNGRIVLSYVPSGPAPGTATRYPFLYSRTPNTGVANYYLTNFLQMTRYTTDGPATAATFGNGTITASTHSLTSGLDVAPTFLEAWTRLATREGWYWRYTPKPYVVGTRTLGTVDFMVDPGTDRGTIKQVVFSRNDGTLLNLSLTANADRFANDVAVTGQSTIDGGGIAFWRDIGTIIKYGVLQDEVLAFTHSDFNTLRRAAYQIVSNKINLSASGAKVAVVLRDPQTADVWRELDKVMIHDPLLGIYYLVARVLGYTFDEGKPTQTLYLDQFSWEY